jgi:uncharacterized membrane protein
MNAVSDAFRLVGMIIFIGWFGFLFFHFGAQYEGNEKELGPTILGIGFFLMLPILGIFMLIVRRITGASVAASHEKDMQKFADREAQSKMDADAIMERYLAERNARSYAEPDISSTLPAPARRPAFGRKSD